ncbi:MAG: ABC transporter ATP-binding protein [Burkholderiaceae bacterium]|nr:ABC transporter ATP-binding protein [Microbacteriaceae bacterium]
MLIEVEALEHRFTDTGDPVIRSFSHRFEPGTLTAVTGPSGSGKSTLMYILALMLTPSGGRTLWDGDDVQALPDNIRSRLRAQYVGFVFQDALLDPSQTALDNVLEAGWLAGMRADVSRSRARMLLDRFGVAERADHLPGQVSGGQAQRIALCRALVKTPTIVFADEPTGNLDSDSARIVWTALADAAQEGATVVVATHDRARATDLPHRLELA